MATVREIARRAGVSSEDAWPTNAPTRFETEHKVRDAIDELGAPS